MTALQILQEGPFPNHIDPWAERGRYFHQLHGHIITYLLDQLTEPLFQLGYGIGRELSLLVADNHMPDLFLEENKPQPRISSKYAEAAATLQLEAGTKLAEAIPDLDRLIIQTLDTSTLVTVIELISPNNKTKQSEMLEYQIRRDKLLQDAVNVVEIDLTRSKKRLLDDTITKKYPYHIAIYPFDDEPYFLGISLNQALKSFALPLRGEPLAVDLNTVYRAAYAKLLIARQIQKEAQYRKESLPFPSHLSPSERQYLFACIQQWQGKL